MVYLTFGSLLLFFLESMCGNYKSLTIPIPECQKPIGYSHPLGSELLNRSISKFFE